MRNLITCILLLIGIIILASCDADPCKSNDSTILKASFYTLDDKGVRSDTAIEKFITVGMDCLPDTPCSDLYLNITQIQINLSTINDSTRFEFWADTFRHYYDTAYNMTLNMFGDSIGKTWTDTIPLGLDSVYNIVYIDTTKHGWNYDTVAFYYARRQRMESPECGVYIDFILTDIVWTTNFIDTIIIMQPVVDESGYENIGIYY